MQGEESAATRDLLDRMPPVRHAPILEKLGELGFKRFREEYAIATPVDPETGIVDHEAFVTQVKGLVDDSYQWKAPFFDEHHLHWYGRLYEKHPDNADVAARFRDLPIHKLWVPRQFHDFAHLVTLPPPVPDVEVMRRSVKDFRRNHYLYTIATNAIELRERTERLRRFESSGETIFIDPQTRRATRDRTSYETRRQDYIRVIERHHRRGLIDLTELTPIELRDQSDIERLLPEIQRFTALSIVQTKGRAARKVDLPIETAA